MITRCSKARPVADGIAAGLAGGIAIVLTAIGSAPAAELYNDGDLSIRWDNTLRYSLGFRLAGQDRALLDDPNTDDGDRNFKPGLIDNRIDLTSRLDIARDGFGFEGSAAGWYDSVYYQGNDNNSPGTFNPVSVPHNQFTATTRGLDGKRAEIDDAFLYGKTEIGQLPFSFRVGRQTLLWGESLFFPDNGIAGAQAPIDVIRETLDPGTYSKDIFLPVAQASASLGLGNGMTLEAYYQFEWRPTRLPGSGSYFSTDDYVDPGGERYVAVPGRYYFYEDFAHDAPASGQFGAAFRFSAGQVDYGLYALRFNAKDPEIYVHPGIEPSYGGPRIVDPSVVDLAIGKIGTYYRVYPKDIDLYGVSASFYLGDTSIATELSARRNMPLESVPQLVRANSTAISYPLYAVGDTLNGDISSITNFARNRLWDSAVLSADIAAKWRLGITRNRDALDPSAKDVAMAFRATFEPTYFEVLPHLDLTFRVGFGYDIVGTLSDDPYQTQSEGAGTVDFGVTATYRVVWSASATITHFFGAPYQQPFADRDYLILSIQRTF
jgi:hypothetical protein